MIDDDAVDDADEDDDADDDAADADADDDDADCDDDDDDDDDGACLPHPSSFGLLSLLLPTLLETMLRTNRCVPKARLHATVKVPIPP